MDRIDADQTTAPSLKQQNLFTLIMLGFLKLLIWREEFNTWVKTFHWSVGGVIMLGVFAFWSILWAVVFPPMLILYWGGLLFWIGIIGLLWAWGMTMRGVHKLAQVFRTSPEQV